MHLNGEFFSVIVFIQSTLLATLPLCQYSEVIVLVIIPFNNKKLLYYK